MRRENRGRGARRHILREESGLTLLEMIIALAILTVGIGGVLHAFSSSMVSAKAAESYSLAAILGQQVAMELERRPDIEAGMLSGSFEGVPGYTWEAEVEETDTGLMRAAITVFWQAGEFDMVVCLRPPADTQGETVFEGFPPQGQ